MKDITIYFSLHNNPVVTDETVVRSFLNKHFLMGFLCKFILLCVSWTWRSVSNDHLEKKELCVALCASSAMRRRCWTYITNDSHYYVLSYGFLV